MCVCVCVCVCVIVFIYTTNYCWCDFFQPKTISPSSCHMMIEQIHYVLLFARNEISVSYMKVVAFSLILTLWSISLKSDIPLAAQRTSWAYYMLSEKVIFNRNWDISHLQRNKTEKTNYRTPSILTHIWHHNSATHHRHLWNYPVPLPFISQDLFLMRKYSIW
jgi:hypothetical protein